MYVLKEEQNMRVHLSIVLASVMTLSLVHTENMTQSKVEKMRTAIDSAVIRPDITASLVDADPCVQFAAN